MLENQMGKDSSDGDQQDRLDSWKEIAAYLQRDLKTVQRWEKGGGLPVYRSAEGKRRAVYAYRSEIDEWIRSDGLYSPRATRPRWYRKAGLVWIGAVSALSLVAAATHLWLNSSADQPATPVEAPAWVLITDFDNRSGEARFDETVEMALRRELANSRHVLVVAPERIENTLALMKRPSDVRIDANLGREICLRYGGIRALLAGRVDKFDSSYLLSLEVVDPTDGRTVASAEEEATGEAEVLPAVHRLGDWLREHLGEELVQIRLDHAQLEEVTTPSLRALELYSKGMRFFRGQSGSRKIAEAESLFRQALEEDPEFASANLFAFWSLYHQGKSSEDEARSLLKRAFELADSTSDQERYFIEGTYYDFIEGNDEKACRSYGTLADFFPDHPWAAGNAAYVCGVKLGQREGMLRWVQAAEVWPGWTALAAESLSFLEGDFDGARPYVDQMRDAVADGDELLDELGGTEAVAFTEFFSAEEYLDRELLPDALSELQRVEQTRKGMPSSVQGPIAQRLLYFYLALGRFRDALALVHDTGSPRLFGTWSAFLTGDQTAFREHLEDFRGRQLRRLPAPAKRLEYYLGLNNPFGVLAPSYDLDSASEMAAILESWPTSDSPFSGPVDKAKLELALGRQMFTQGRLGEARARLKNSADWFRDNGGWVEFSYYFLSAELLASVLAERGNLQAAYRVLEDAARQRDLVWSFTAPLYQRIQARLAVLCRELDRIAEAEAIEAELTETLKFADQDHPILLQIHEKKGVLMKIE